jgi:flagellar biosynthetic protein FlhB
LDKARKDGQFAVSRDFTGAMQFLVFVILLANLGQDWLSAARQTCAWLLGLAFLPGDLTAGRLMSIGLDVCWRTLLPLLGCGALMAMAALGAHLATTRCGPVTHKAAPDLKRLNPLPRLRELPHQNLSLFVYSLVLLPLFGWFVHQLAKENLPTIVRLAWMAPEPGLRAVSASIQSLLWKAALVFLVLGGVDLYRQQRRYMKSLRMSKQEIRDEYKEIEGNPQIKAHIRRLQRSFARKRMMSEVPKATAVIVNPTHFAVALRYQMESMPAPRVVAKGRNYLAQRIRQLAMEHEVPIVENPPLAQALYKSAEIGQEIPVHLYRAVAEVLAYIFRLTQTRTRMEH